MSTAVQYVIEPTKEGDFPEITEEGHLTDSNYKLMKFGFGPPNDITESLNKKKTSTTEDVSVTVKGRTAYAAGSITYPDKNVTSTVVITDCVVQFREGILKKDNSNYAVDFVCIGIPTKYIEKMSADAKSNSTLIVRPKPKVQNLEGFSWFDCSLEKIKEGGISIIANTGDEYNTFQVDLQSILKEFKKGIKATVMTTMSAIMTTEIMSEKLDLTNGTYYFTFKPTEIILLDASDKVGPTLQDTNRRNAEKMGKTENHIASDLLARYALSKLSIK